MNTYSKEQLQQHGEVILAYINGASIEYTHPEKPEAWYDIECPNFSSGVLYRVVKPKRKMVLLRTVITKDETTEHFRVVEDDGKDSVAEYIRVTTVIDHDFTSTCEIIHTFELESLE